jgi:hypothetical protein
LLTAEHRQALMAIIESGPTPAIHGVVRWRLCDLGQWLWEEFQLSISKQTLSRELRAMGMRRGRPTRAMIRIKAKRHRLNRQGNGVPHFLMGDRCRPHSTGNGSISPGSVIASGCRPSRIASTMSGARSVNRSSRET